MDQHREGWTPAGGAAEDHRFEALVQHSSDILMVLDNLGVLTYVSPSVEALLGYQPAEIVGMPATDFIHPDDLESVLHEIARVLETPGGHGGATYRARHADGSWRLFEAMGQNQLDHPAVRGLVINSRDITARVQAEQALRATQERFEALVKHASDLVTVTDLNGVVSYISPSVKRLLGYETWEIEGGIGRTLIHPDDLERGLAAITRQIRSNTMSEPVQYRWRHRDGSWRVFEGVTADLRNEPSVRGMVTNARDVTERVDAERKAAQLTEVLEKTNEVVVLSDPSGTIVYANQRARAFLGLGVGEEHVSALSSPESRERLRTEIMPFVRRHGLWTGELTLRTAESDELPALATVQAHREDREIVLVSTIAHDITELKKAQHRLEYEATHDALTGLPNRALFVELGDQALGRAGRHHTTTAVLFLDLDRFKAVNDSLGHPAGDRVLIEVGRRLRVGVRTGDFVARLGGDEFCVLCERVADEQEVHELGRRLVDAVSSPLRVDGRDVKVGTSIGIALERGNTRTIGSLVRDADVALYRAKREGGDRVELFDESLEELR